MEIAYVATPDLSVFDYFFLLYISVCLFIPQYLSGDVAFTLLNLEILYLILCEYIKLIVCPYFLFNFQSKSPC